MIKHRHELSHFSIIGFTEKELGPSLLKRMTAIARVRRALKEVNLDLPIHVFGSLDTISTPLYFLAGADIFDGLTWLRYAFRDGVRIPMMSISHSDLMPISSERSDAGLSQCETVIDIRQEFCLPSLS